MKARIPLAFVVALLVGAAAAACAARRPAMQPPEAHEAPPPSQDDPRARLVRALDTLKEPGTRAEKTTDTARSVIEAIGGSAEKQGDGGLTDR